MRKSILLVILLIASCFILRVSAQHTAKKGSKKTDSTQVKKLPPLQEVPVYLGSSGLTGGPISKGKFDSFAKQGLTLGSAQPGGGIKSFNFIYAERVLYEDSMANPIIITDYLTESCDGPQLSPGIVSTLFERTKPGDTAFFDGVRVRLASGVPGKGKSLKFVLTR